MECLHRLDEGITHLALLAQTLTLLLSTIANPIGVFFFAREHYFDRTRVFLYMLVIGMFLLVFSG